MINGGVDGGAGSVNYFLDGGTNMTGLRNTGNIAPNPDAVEEFRVVTNSYSAEDGRFAGGMINIITRSGTNAFHGSVFEFLRNNDLNAYDWGALSMAPLHRNQFGGSFGGPIRKDKTFFFGTYSGLRQNISQFLNSAVVPSSLERAGNFSADKAKPNDPLANNAPFPGGIIPGNRFDAVASKILNTYIPAANLINNDWQGFVPNPHNTDEALIKIEAQRAPTHHRQLLRNIRHQHHPAAGQSVLVHAKLQLTPAERKPERHLDAHRKYRQPVLGQLHAQPRRPPEPARHLARRSRLRLPSAGHAFAAADHGYRLLHAGPVDRRPVAGTNFYARRTELQPRTSHLQVRRRDLARQGHPADPAQQLRRLLLQRRQNGQRLC
jgi:hypothetical protein